MQFGPELRRSSFYLSQTVLALGLLVLLGWALELEVLTRLWPSWPVMSVSAAIGFTLVGLALLARARWGSSGLILNRAVGAFLIWHGCRRLLSAYWGLDLGMGLGPWEALPLALFSSSSFVVTGLALLLIDLRWLRQAPTEWLAAVLWLLAMTALLGQAYDTPTPFLAAAFDDVALHTALGFQLVGAALILASPRHRMVLAMADGGPGGVLARRMLPGVLVLPMLVGWLGVAGEQGRYFSSQSVAIVVVLGGIIAGLFLTFWVFGAAKQAGIALTQEEERLRVTLRSIGDGVIAVDLQMRVTMLNLVAERLTGWLQEEALGRPLPEVFRMGPSAEGVPVENPVLKALRKDAVFELKDPFVLLSRAGLSVQVADSSAPIHDSEGRMIGAVLVFRDVTAKQRSDQELLKLQKLESLAVLAGGIAHDFNNILSVILANVSLAASAKGAEQDACLRDAEAAVARGGQLAAQLMTFAKGGAEVRKPIDLGPVVEEAVRFALTGTSSRATFELGTESAVVDADPGQISQVIQNLVLNASQSMPSGGLIHIAMEGLAVGSEHGLPLPEGRYHRIDITDQGHGIKPEVLERIFDPFFTTKVHGNGLGLASAHRIAKSHRGHLRAETQLGRGSRFSLYLPATAQGVLAAPPPSRSAARGQGRVLVMDDDDGIMKVTLRMLASLGYRAEGAAEGLSALALADKALQAGDPFDAAILDLTVPGGMGGLETVKRLLQKQPKLKVVVASGYSADPVMEAPAEHGFSAAMPKPFGLHAMSQMLKNLLG